MSKFGTKHACWSCGTKFYDLNKPEPKCPKCGSDPREAPTAGQVADSPPADDDDFADDFDDLDEATAAEEADEEEEEDEPDIE